VGEWAGPSEQHQWRRPVSGEGGSIEETRLGTQNLMWKMEVSEGGWMSSGMWAFQIVFIHGCRVAIFLAHISSWLLNH
jgi:hypothetical protein